MTPQPAQPRRGRVRERRGSARDRALIRRAAWRAALQSAALVALSVLLCGVLVLLVVDRGQRRATDTLLTMGVAKFDGVTDAAPGVYLSSRTADGTVRTTPGAPRSLPDRDELDDLAADPAGTVHTAYTRSPSGQDFQILTKHLPGRSGLVVQAAVSLRDGEAERQRLRDALAAGGGLALVAAAAVGLITGRRAVLDLVTTVGRQRRFVADASHELRTPLTLLSTRAQLLERHLLAAELGPADRATLQRDTARLIGDSSRLAELLEELLLSAEPGAHDRDVTDLADLARDTVDALGPVAADRGVALSVEALPPGGRAGQRSGAGPPPAPVLVRGGQSGVRRCLVALLDNAIRHTPEGGIVTVRVGTARGQGSVLVSDSGPGIPEAVRDRVFDRFAHGPETARDSSAHGPEAARDVSARDAPGGVGAAGGGRRRYGLGLALVADTMDRFGGSVTFETSAKGTTFTLRLPLVR